MLIEAAGHGAKEQDGPAFRIRTPDDTGHVEASCIWRDELELDRRANREHASRAQLGAA
jgi:hypothetical protein